MNQSSLPRRFLSFSSTALQNSGGARGLVIVALVALSIGFGACQKGGGRPTDGGADKAGTSGDGGGGAQAKTDAKTDATATDGGDGGKSNRCSTAGASATKPNAIACACDNECASGFCADGVCCESACTDQCKSCGLPSTLGQCTFVPAGAKPSVVSQCVATDPTTCGLDGTCDGSGSCRRHVAQTPCKTGTCDGDGITNAFVCDGKGGCGLGPVRGCYPYSCNTMTDMCTVACTTNAQCAAGQQCVNGECGKTMNGGSCTANQKCASGFCADGVCCNVACAGACVSCNQTGKMGRCSVIDTGLPDPDFCKVNGPTTCDTTGLCDGFGSCAKFPANTLCSSPTCAGDSLQNTARACDGQGTCRDSQLVDCAPSRCANGVCNKTCMVDADCIAGHPCVKTTMNNMTVGQCSGKKKNGQSCTAVADCESGFCADGVCCESACTGACRSCGLPTNLGQCINVASGSSDPRKMCSDKGKATCGTNGLCDGAGSCQKYPTGTDCATEICASGAYTPGSTCNAAGQCVPPASRTCNPYICNGSKCFTTCTKDAQCVAGKFCVNGSCGQKDPGSDCNSAADCKSGFCAQGVCCNTACNGACLACNLPATNGICTGVTDGTQDPQGMCAVTGQTTCGTTGLCKGGACAYWANGSKCKDAKCATTSSVTPVSACDGKGACLTPVNVPCGTFLCDTATTSCKNTCKADTDCVSPNTCVNNSCGLKPAGAACTAATQCATGFCTEGVCCNTACSDPTTGLCQSCKVAGKVGTCSPVPSGGTDPKGRCTATVPSAGNCANDGTCNGAGACRPWSTATGCRTAVCSGSTFTPSANCDGKGACPAATTSMCNPYICSTTSASCLTTCTGDTQCTDKLTCLATNNQCGDKLPNGKACKAATDCTTGNCVDGFCCNVACTGGCQSCTLSGSVGTCTSIGAGNSPRTTSPVTCAAATAASCGNTGKCNGSNGCQLYAAGDPCGAASCAAPTAGTVGGAAASESLASIPAKMCNGSGTCVTPAAVSCGAFQCDGSTGLCKSTCGSTNLDCNALTPPAGGGYICVGSGCQKKTNGLVCTAGSECVSGNCVDGRCCGSAACGACTACNIAGPSGSPDGTCRPVGKGTADASCPTTAASTCGTDGKCDGAGACENYTGGTCAVAKTCIDGLHESSATSSCSGAGTCSTGASAACTAGYKCVASTSSGACATDCTAGNQATNCDTGNGYTCVGGKCQKMGMGGACTATSQCGGSFTCVDGVCCMSPSCDDCSACNLAGTAGTCAPVAAGTEDGKCVATCSAGQMSGKCDGAGACRGARDCGTGYACSGTSCATTCTGTNTGCSTGYACFNGMCKKANGQTCGVDGDCGTNICVDGICCAGSCSACNTCASGTGLCKAIASGGTPRDTITCAVTTTCGKTGKCNGFGDCAIASDTTTCAGTPMTCSGNQQSGGGGTCDGSGNCISPASMPCNIGYQCVGTACPANCSSAGAAACATGYSCDGTNCKIANGKSCTGDADCASKHCEALQGGGSICCAVNCTDTTSNNTTCGTKAFCASSGAACVYNSGTVCAAPTCNTAGDAVAQKTCDNAGACSQGGAITNCNNSQTCTNAMCVQNGTGGASGTGGTDGSGGASGTGGAG